METVLMAKKKPASRAQAERPPLAVTVRGCKAWKAWVEDLAGACRMDVSTLVDTALVELAKARGFDEPAPRR